MRFRLASAASAIALSAVVVTLAAPAVTFPLRVSANRQHLEDSTGAPFLVVGDTAWSLVAQLNETDIERYLDDRAARGFNAIIVNLLEHKFASRAPANRWAASSRSPPAACSRSRMRSTSTSPIARSTRPGAAASRSGCVRRIWDGTAATKGSSRRSMPRGTMRCATTAGSWVSVSRISPTSSGCSAATSRFRRRIVGSATCSPRDCAMAAPAS